MTATRQNKRGPIGWGILVVFGAVAIYLIYSVFNSEPCADVLPQNKRVGIKLNSLSKDRVELDFSGQRGVQPGATPEQIEGYIKCLEASKKEVTIKNGVRLPLEPVGQVANRWARESGLHLRLMPGSNDEALNNLRIGPATGLKENVVRDWCSPQKAGSCVSCEPDQPTAETVEVLVRLRDNAPLQKLRMDGTWPVPQPNAQSEPWQIVNGKGERFYYDCKHP